MTEALTLTILARNPTTDIILTRWEGGIDLWSSIAGLTRRSETGRNSASNPASSETLTILEAIDTPETLEGIHDVLHVRRPEIGLALCKSTPSGRDYGIFQTTGSFPIQRARTMEMDERRPVHGGEVRMSAWPVTLFPVSESTIHFDQVSLF